MANKTVCIDILDVLEKEANNELSVLDYFIKLHLRDHGIPVKIDPINIGLDEPPFEVECGTLDYHTNEQLQMVFEYAQ